MLDDNLKTQLKAYLEKLIYPIELSAALDESEASVELKSLLEDLAHLSNKIKIVEEKDKHQRKPSFSINRAGENMKLRFAGVPLGHEFTSLVLALLHAGGHPSKVAQSVIEQIQNLKGSFKFETYYSLTCHNCPDVVQALNLMAVLNPNIEHVAIDGALYQSEIESRQIMGVPAVFLNGAHFGQGRMELEEILAKVDTQSAAKNALALSDKAAFDVLVVGAGPAGAAAAIYAARKGIRTAIVTERFGGQTLDTLGIENYISIKETEGPKFAAALEAHVRDYEVDIMGLQRGKRLIPASPENGNLVHLELASGAVLKSKTVILATGARWRDMNVAGEKEYRTKGVTYCPHCDGPLFKGKRVAVIGGGNSGVEAAIDLAGVVSHVTLLEFAPTLRADDVLQRKLRSLKNVTIIANAQTSEVVGDGQKVTGLKYNDRTNPENLIAHSIELEGVFVQIGLLPNTDWLKETIDLSKHGEIITDAKGQTSVAGIFAAGDVTTTPFKQIIIAAGDGAKAALGAFDYLMRN